MDEGDSDCTGFLIPTYQAIAPSVWGLMNMRRNGQKHADSFTKPFILDSSAKAYADQFARGMEFKIRVKPSDPSVSVADSTVENW